MLFLLLQHLWLLVLAWLAALAFGPDGEQMASEVSVQIESFATSMIVGAAIGAAAAVALLLWIVLGTSQRAR